ncbi:hypothetical protein ACA910_018677 [Epithemia clementina (nom. ined.)]
MVGTPTAKTEVPTVWQAIADAQELSCIANLKAQSNLAAIGSLARLSQPMERFQNELNETKYQAGDAQTALKQARQDILVLKSLSQEINLKFQCLNMS